MFNNNNESNYKKVVMIDGDNDNYDNHDAW